METRLMNAALQLPVPQLDFEKIKQTARGKTIQMYRPHLLCRALLTAVLILACCMTGFAYAKTHYGLWSGYHSLSFADVEILSRRYDYILPEELGESPFSQMSTSLAAPVGASHLEAIFSPTYKLHSIYYGAWQEDDPNTGIENRLCVGLGTTEKETWKYHFSVAEDGTCSDKNVKHGSQSVVEYMGYILHLYAIEDRYSVRWQDEDRKLVIDITCFHAVNFDVALETAKMLIEMNK